MKCIICKGEIDKTLGFVTIKRGKFSALINGESYQIKRRSVSLCADCAPNELKKLSFW